MHTLEPTRRRATDHPDVPAASDRDAPRLVEDAAAPLPDRDLSPRAARWLMAVTLVAATALRLWLIGSVGFNSDEAVYSGQGAALLGDAGYAQYFSLFRAHPLLLQLVVGLGFKVGGVHDTLARVVVVLAFAVPAVLFTYLLTARLRGRAIGVVAAVVVATLPYHVIVSRQVLVDVAMGGCMAAAFWLLARHLTRDSERALIGAFALLGLAALAKEIAVLAIVPVAIVLLMHEGARIFRRRGLWTGAVLWAMLVAAFPLTRLINQPTNASDFVLWQISREPNHDPDYFLRVLLQYAGPIFLVALLVGIVAAVRRRDVGDRMVLAWVGVFALFFSVWPTKLFPYLFPIIPGLAYLVASGIAAVAQLVRRASWLAVAAALTAVLVLASTGSTISTITAGPTAQLPGWADFDIEIQSFAGGRELGEWAAGTPSGARFLTIGPSIGNVLRFYGHRDSVALSVSEDPRLRNPAYVPVPNPDLAIRRMAVHYAIWDAYSADRSVFYNARLMDHVRRYHGVPVFASYVDGRGELRTVEGTPPEGADKRIVVYDLSGGGPQDATAEVPDQ